MSSVPDLEQPIDVLHLRSGMSLGSAISLFDIPYDACFSEKEILPESSHHQPALEWEKQKDEGGGRCSLSLLGSGFLRLLAFGPQSGTRAQTMRIDNDARV